MSQAQEQSIDHILGKIKTKLQAQEAKHKTKESSTKKAESKHQEQTPSQKKIILTEEVFLEQEQLLSGEYDLEYKLLLQDKKFANLNIEVRKKIFAPNVFAKLKTAFIQRFFNKNYKDKLVENFLKQEIQKAVNNWCYKNFEK